MRNKIEWRYNDKTETYELYHLTYTRTETLIASIRKGSEKYYCNFKCPNVLIEDDCQLDEDLKSSKLHAQGALIEDALAEIEALKDLIRALGGEIDDENE